MTKFEYISLSISLIVLLLLPCIGLILRLTVKWTRAESKLEEIANDMKEMVEDKEKIHRELYNLINRSADNMDKRMRWVEENIWKRKASD